MLLTHKSLFFNKNFKYNAAKSFLRRLNIAVQKNLIAAFSCVVNKQKAFLPGLLITILFLATAATSWAASGVLGDVNDDGEVTIIDALMVAHAYIADPAPAGFVAEQADVNLDGNITIVDALIIAQYYVKLIPSLPPPCYTLAVTPADWITLSPQSSCYSHGTRVRLSALAEYHDSPPPGMIIIGGDFYFSHWEDMDGKLLSAERVITITMNSNKMLKAVYDQIW